MSIINSLLDTDTYKLSMGQCVFHQFSKYRPITRFKFKCRNANNLSEYIDDINKEIDHLCTLRFSSDEINYLRTISWLSQDFVDFLEFIQLKRATSL